MAKLRFHEFSLVTYMLHMLILLTMQQVLKSFVKSQRSLTFSFRRLQ